MLRELVMIVLQFSGRSIHVAEHYFNMYIWTKQTIFFGINWGKQRKVAYSYRTFHRGVTNKLRSMIYRTININTYKIAEMASSFRIKTFPTFFHTW